MEDCAGLLTAGIALSDVAREFKRHHVCVGASESNVKLHSWLASLVHFLDTDAAERAVSTQKFPKGRMPFYIAGYPCGPWSRSGPMQGEADARCKVTYELEKVIDTFRPKFVLLENTPKFKVLWDKRLQPALKKHNYATADSVANSNGWEQQFRDRFYGLGVASEHAPPNVEICTLLPTPPATTLPTFSSLVAQVRPHLTWQPVAGVLDAHSGNSVFVRNLDFIRDNAPDVIAASPTSLGKIFIVGDMGASRQRPHFKVHSSMCITKARAEQRRLWLLDASLKNRACMPTALMSLLQGWSMSEYTHMASFISDKELRGALGNGMTKSVMRSWLQLLVTTCKI